MTSFMLRCVRNRRRYYYYYYYYLHITHGSPGFT